jgi:hypothetical protein
MPQATFVLKEPNSKDETLVYLLFRFNGSKTEKSFLKYIKISQEDNANKLINHPFFN